ncbi:protein-L-isoaspartate(D-aspartate) O-methyltransferase [Gallaecimonas pentaromativorans]|uniref:Protein-L-isoaspartate O-methyltransferase n=1 Tax=Gallaecimonas pentaromativorans TaxID=584787 RepID=A0A3N1PFS5_9GAMM|nr:protein-L-isoaspartate(D-aspartate) O-methyltransferase [Gallaecimonas pentaromativorans]MED5526380.1 protein-L-isoaspartate(D-aspartate) O-methyltransferase [Pseudomonadota bacterium]ROQ25710.1 protein-L-isoaspartate(D-aspartate) O-methyltransferase [Gallaecimonas pentaromativorans]
MANDGAGARTRLTAQLRQEGVCNERVLAAMAAVPRHWFVDDVLGHKAYDNTALPIGEGQTISQPYIVARMTELLLRGGSLGRVLEIGTGSGYQTAVLAQLCEQVFSVERIKNLQYQARRRLQRLDLHNVQMKHGDGWQGWSTKAPFDGIIVTAAPSAIPDALLAQLADGGVMVIPVGDDQQLLKVITRQGQTYTVDDVEWVRFVPLISGSLL